MGTMELDFFQTAFRPAEAARLTGVSPALMRNWRGKDILPSHQGAHGRFGIFDMGLLVLARGLRARGLGSGVATLARWGATAVARHAIGDIAAWAPHPDMAGLDLASLVDQAVRQLSPLGPDKSSHRPGRFMVMWSDTEADFVDSLDAAGTSTERILDPAVSFDTLALGRLIREAAGRPLVGLNNAIPAACRATVH